MKAFFFCVRSTNVGLITAYSLLTVYVLVRTVPADVYPWVVFFSAIANYALAADLGYAGFIYAETRRRFIKKDMEGQDRTISEAVNVYVLVPLVISPIVALFIFWTVDSSFEIRAGLSLFFLSVILSLPWMLFRRVGAAVDLFVHFEVLELVRRVAFLASAASMLIGVTLLWFAVICIAIWLCAFSGAVILLRHRNVHIRLGKPSEIVLHLRENAKNIATSGSFTGLDFLIYNLPYVLLPFMYTDASRIVAFDIFFKTLRLAGVAQGVATETFQPYQTRAFHERDFRAVRKYCLIIILLGAVPATGVSLGIIYFGDEFFQFLLNGVAHVSPVTHYAMIAMIFLVLLQGVPGSLIVGVGLYRQMRKIGMVTVTLMIALYLVTFLADVSFDMLISGYVAIYGLHTLMVGRLFLRLESVTR